MRQFITWTTTATAVAIIVAAIASLVCLFAYGMAKTWGKR